MLAQLLTSLSSLEACSLDIILVVVDNDAAASAAATVEAAREHLQFPLFYAVEPTRNIAAARNRVVAVALERGAEWLAFVDDDETVSPGWLNELIRVQREFTADVVQGPVESRLSPATPQWVKDGRLFTSPRCADGVAVRAPSTANVLVTARLIRRLGEAPFDVAYGISGGSDWHLFLRARLAGATAVWAHDALVWETIPRTRATTSWVLRRAFRTGNAGAFIDRELLPVRVWLPARLVRTTAHLGLGLLCIGPSAFIGRGRMVASARHIAHALGSLTGMVGWRFLEYTRQHGE